MPDGCYKHAGQEEWRQANGNCNNESNTKALFVPDPSWAQVFQEGIAKHAEKEDFKQILKETDIAHGKEESQPSNESGQDQAGKEPLKLVQFWISISVRHEDSLSVKG